ncbi:uncharacterized protein N7503_004914 [Penicillium pulvis]|uniref:uncharacterized protein n=1 Tax=Penicillium pulvis TaxID=1562058 RepID=UPI002549BB82|nr:uncharacterized protein N7503_004914 [Penicillium pulvis]KAJ5802464.1 hypothetical protein N7503_004914 [Penicillium pulvis]
MASIFFGSTNTGSQVGINHGTVNIFPGRPENPPQRTMCESEKELFKDREKRFGSYEEDRWAWSEEELQKLLSQILTEGTKVRPVILFIDALDECGQTSARDLLKYFKELMKEVKREGGQVKICFSSRHYPILGHGPIPSILVEKHNTNDIQRIIGDLLKEIEIEEDRKYFESEILSKARGGFQWVVLVCKRAIEENIIGTKREYLHRRFTTVPEALNGLYSIILHDVHGTERQQMVKLFQWILFSERPLSAHELRDALSIEMDMESGTQLRSHSSWSDTLDRFEVHVRHISKGLVEFRTREIWEQYEPGEEDSDREAQVIHQSVADFLLHNFLGCAVRDQYSSQSVIGAGHFHISRSCLRYITLDGVLEGARRLSRNQLFQKFQLIPYAIRFLFQHIKEVELQNIPQPDLLSLIYWHQKSRLQEIARFWRVSDPDSVYTPRGWPFVEATALHVLITFGSKSAFDDLLEKDDVEVDGRDIDGNTPLLLAIKERHYYMAVELLNRFIEWHLQRNMAAGNLIGYGTSIQREGCYVVNVDAQNNDDDTPLSIAMEDAAPDVILKLIDAGVNPNTQDRSGQTPLSWASERGDQRIVKLLLERGANPNILDSSGRTPLSRASERGHETVVNLLLEQGSNPSILDSSGRTPLSRASERGYKTAVKLLLEQGVNPDILDGSGRTPLSRASERGHEIVIKLLLEQGADPNSLDSSGRRPLSWVLDSGDEKVAKLLLKRGADPNASDRSGQTPLFWALERGYEKVAKLLLKHGADPNIPDSSGRTALSRASARGYERVAKLLLEHGVDPNTPDSSGRTPLSRALESGYQRAYHNSHWTSSSYALESGHQTVVELLLNEGANPKPLDSSGQTPLSYASERGDERVAKLLLEHGADPNALDSSSRTPLTRAAEGGYETVVKLLLEHGANPNLDVFGWTPYRFALAGGHERVAKLLL